MAAASGLSSNDAAALLRDRLCGGPSQAPFDSVEIVESANLAKKRRVEESGPAQEEGSGDTTVSLHAAPGAPLDAEPKPDSETRKLFGDLGLYD